MKYYTILFALLACQLIFTQGSSSPKPEDFLPKIIPPSPEAYNLGNYGNIPVGAFTGSPNISIPVITYKTKNLLLDFTLSYSSAGIKVDDVNSRTGLGWNMLGGGVINRVIRNKPDDLEFDYPMKHLNISSLTPYNAIVNEFFNLHGEQVGYDTEKDIFNFSFMNRSGRFYFDSENNIIQIEKSKIKIEIFRNLGDVIFKFKITDENGIIYYFEQTEQIMLRTSGEGRPEPSLNYTSWYLSKIIHPLGDEIYLEYSNHNEYYIASQSQQLSKSYPTFQTCTGGSFYAKPATMGIVYSHHSRVIGKKINSVTSNNPFFGRLDFSYEDKIPTASDPDNVLNLITLKDNNSSIIERVDFNYTVTNNNRIFLDYITFKDPNKKYSFEYCQRDNFPVRLNKSQDHWGYYNSVNNTNLVPHVVGYGLENSNYSGANKEPNPNYSKIGLLNKITYPTKGFTEIVYEANTYYGQVKTLPNQNQQILTLNSILVPNVENSYSFTTSFDHRVELQGDSFFYNCDSDMNTGPNHHKSRVTVFCVNDNINVYLYKYDQYGFAFGIGTSTYLSNNESFYFDADGNKTYIVKIENIFNCTRGTVSLKYYSDNYIITNQNLTGGGNRVGKTITYKDFNDAQPLIKKYYYSKHNQLNVSSGIIGQQPYYLDVNKFKEDTCFFKDIVVSSSSLSNLFEFFGNNICYEYVTISNSENFEEGFEEHQYIVNRDYREHIYRGLDEVRNTPLSNLGWDNGKLKAIRVFKTKNNSYYPVKETINNYIKTYDNPTHTSYLIRNHYPGVFDSQNQDACVCNASNITESYTIQYCNTFHLHRKNSNGLCIENSANNINYNINHPCFNKTIGEVVNIPSIFHMDIMPYKTISYFSFLSSTIEKEYFYNSNNILTGNIEKNIVYKYDNPIHLQLTSTITQNSLGQSVENRNYYPQDSQMNSEPYVNEMVVRNMLATPIKNEVYVNTEKNSERKTELALFTSNNASSPNLLPKFVYSMKGSGSVTTNDRRVSFTEYDKKGNLLQYSLENGVPISIIWGYNQSQPIAKIENATNAQIKTALGIQDLNLVSEANLEAINDLRSNASFANAMITTYTYIPLKGLTSITDPKGDKITYIYDDFNRLKEVRDRFNNIISEHEYHYRTQN